MPITKEQALEELKRRAAVAELEKRKAATEKKVLYELGPRGQMTEVQPPYKSTLQRQWETLQPELGQNIGATAGGLAPEVIAALAGTALGPGGTLAGAIGGAAVGGLIGENIQRSIQQKPDMTWPEMARIAIYQGGMELAGRGVAGLGSRIAAPAKKTLIPSAPEVSKRLAEAAKTMPTEEMSQYTKSLLEPRRRIFKPWAKEPSVFLMPAQATEMRGMDLLESAISHSIFGGGRAQQLHEVIIPAANKQWSKNVTELFWQKAGQHLSNDDLATLIGDTLAGGKTASWEIVKSAYRNIDEIMQLPVDYTAFQKVAKDELMKATGQARMGTSGPRSVIANRALKMPPGDFAKAIVDRSELLREGRRQSILGGFDVKEPMIDKTITNLEAALDKAMEETAKSHSPEAFTAWRKANRLRAEHGKIFGNDTVKAAVKMAQQKPEQFGARILENKSTEQIAAIKKALSYAGEEKGDKAYRSMVAGWVGNQLENTGSLSKFAETLEKMDQEKVKMMFPDAIPYNELKLFGRGQQILDRPVRGAGVLMALTQAGSIVQTATGGVAMILGQTPIPDPWKKFLTGGGAVILIGPAVLGRIMTSPGGVKWLTEGMKTPAIIGVPLKKAPAGVIRILSEEFGLARSIMGEPVGEPKNRNEKSPQ